MNEYLKKMDLSPEILEVLNSVENVIVPKNREELAKLALGGNGADYYEVAYNIPGVGKIVENTVAKCKNGIAVNFTDAYMRRRDPNSMVIADEFPTDKLTYVERFGESFNQVRNDTFKWLASQESLIVLPFMTGGMRFGFPSIAIAPANAGFFLASLADLQKYIPADSIPEGFKPKAFIFVAPTFRHTHYDGKQIVVHNRLSGGHEMFAFNLYPGPSAKKGAYSALLTIGEKEGWTTLHASTAKIITPYDNTFVIMHEGASGGGKSEMLGHCHREDDGRVLLAENTMTKEKIHLDLSENSEIIPVTDDMALVPLSLQKEEAGKLCIVDAEDGWFLRVDHIKHYGTDPALEDQTIHSKNPLLFYNIDAAPNSTALIWEHIMDEPNKPCPNPRVIIPRRFYNKVENEPVYVDLRSFGVRQPPCTKKIPTYGIAGLFHVLPPAIAWLWRLVAPRGYANPSIVDSEGMSAEGVGSFWPFATGRKVDQANLLLEQMLKSRKTRYVLIPNQYIGVYKVGFKAEWISREYLARRGDAKFRGENLVAAKCTLMGFAMKSLKIDGVYIPKELLQVDLQPEVGIEGYKKGATILNEFFKKELQGFLCEDLLPKGREIIEKFLSDAPFEDYLDLIPFNYIEF